MSKYYCGPYWFPKCIRKFLSSRFNASCKIHDLDYKSKRFCRSHTDLRFIKHMLRQSKSTKDVLLAILYYMLVRVAGKISWRK